jgi:hypothetical protein
VSTVRVRDPKLAKLIQDTARKTGFNVQIDDGKGSLDPETFRTEPPETLPEPLKPSRTIPPRILPPKEELESWQSLAERVSKPLGDVLTPSEKRVYEGLLINSMEISKQRGYNGALNLVTWFMPVEWFCMWYEIPRRTFYQAMRKLRRLKLVASRAHHCKAARPSKSETWSDGTIFCVKTNPLSDCEPRVRFDWLKKVYRNLAADIRENRTCWHFKGLLHSQKKGLKALLKFDEFLAWSESPDQRAKLQESMTVQDDFEAYERLFYLPSIEKRARSTEIETLGLWMSAKLHDGDRHKYFKLLWNAVRMADRGVDNGVKAIRDALRIVLSDPDWSKIRSGGALFVTRLKQLGVYEELKREPQTRVGVMP